MELSNQKWNFRKLSIENGTLKPKIELSKLLGGKDKKKMELKNQEWNFLNYKGGMIRN